MADDKGKNQIGEFTELCDSIFRRKIRRMPSSRYSIVKIPKKLRRAMEEAYIPEILSIGPLHCDRDSLIVASTGKPKDSSEKDTFLHRLRPTRCKQYKDDLAFLKASTEKTKDSLKAMEQHKEWYLDALLTRVAPAPESRKVKLKEFIKIVKKLEEETRECYAEPIDLINSDQYAEMMILDSCFIIELFIRKHEKGDNGKWENGKGGNGTGKEFKNDPIFSTVWMMESLQRDLILLENQLPFFVIEDLFNSIKDRLDLNQDLDLEQGGLSLTQLAVNFFDSVISSFGIAVPQHVTGEYKHFLGLLHSILVPDETLPDGVAANNQNSSTRCQNVLNLTRDYLCGCKPSSHVAKPEDSNTIPTDGVAPNKQNCLRHIINSLCKKDSSEEEKSTPWEYIHCATVLRDAGVNFKKKKPPSKNLLDISFDKNSGVLQIPPLKITGYTDPLLRNLVALEQCIDEYGSGVTSYVAFLDTIISTQQDVDLLRRRHIIDCGLSDHDEAALAVNKLGDGVMVKRFLLENKCHDVNTYYKTPWHRWRSILKREYFKNPWASISILVAFVIMALSLTQTIFAVLSYIIDHT